MTAPPLRYYRRLRARQAYAQGWARLAAGRAADAAAAFDAAAALADGDTGFHRRALDGAIEAYRTAGDLSAAMARAEQLAHETPGDADAILALARLRDAVGHPHAAPTWAKRLILAADCPEAGRRLMQALSAERDPALALEAWLSPGGAANDDAGLQVGLVLYDLGRRSLAAPYLLAAAGGRPRDAGLWRRIAWCRSGQEDLDGEAEALAHVLAIEPKDDEARSRLIEVLIDAGRRGETEPLLADLVTRRTDDVRLFVHLARARRDLGDTAAALETWRQVLAMNPAEPDANYNVGYAVLAEGDVARAADHLAAAAPALPKPAQAWRRVADLRREIGDRAGLIVALRGSLAAAETSQPKLQAELDALLA
ncbi:MAG: hypothetical protein BGN86_12665 [Caulobacterales bacterium 68-7]|nr:MAG: hypothetical protein BGN86_12665 [Caulobacterales bacterium 68-7]